MSPKQTEQRSNVTLQKFINVAGNEEPIFSIVCASNRPEVLESYLLKSLREQTMACELRVVNAKAQGYSSAAQTLNAGAVDARGRYLMFVHQDVALEGRNWLSDAAAILDRLGNSVGVAGPVGAMAKAGPDGRRRINTFYSGEEKSRVNRPALTEPTLAQTLDELMLIVPRRVFERVTFDENVCQGWHLYGVDLCLCMQNAGLGVYVLPLLVHHLSGGQLDATYYRTLSQVIRKHRGRVGRIVTTSETWPTRLPGLLHRRWHQAKVVGRHLRARLTGGSASVR